MADGGVSTGATVSTTPIGNPPDDWLPAASAAVQVAAHVPSGTNVELPSTASGALPDGPVRIQLTDAAPASSVAETVTFTLAPPAALPSTFASALTSPRMSDG